MRACSGTRARVGGSRDQRDRACDDRARRRLVVRLADRRLSAEADLPTTKWEEEVARGLELGLPQTGPDPLTGDMPPSEPPPASPAKLPVPAAAPGRPAARWSTLPGDDKELVYAPLGTAEADAYLDDMALGANFATLNHLLIQI